MFCLLSKSSIPPKIWEHATLQSLHAILIFGGKQEMWGRVSYPSMHHTTDCFRGWDRRVIIQLNRYPEHSACVSQAGRKTQNVSLGSLYLSKNLLTGKTSKTRFYKLPAARFSHLKLKNQKSKTQKFFKQFSKNCFCKNFEINKKNQICLRFNQKLKKMA